MKKLINILFNKSYFPFCLSYFLDVFNVNFFRVILAIFIVSELTVYPTQTRVFIASSLLSVLLLPTLLFSTMFGELADKYRKDIIVKVVKFSQLILTILAVVGFILNNIWLLIAVLFFVGVASTLFSPARFSIIPELLEQDDLGSGNSIMQSGTYMSMLLGNILGICLYSFSPKAMLIISLVVSFVGYVSSLFIPKLKTNTQKIEVSFNFIKSIFNNLKFFNYSRDVYLCILGISWFWFIGVILVYQIPNFAEIIVNKQQELFVVLISLLALGVFFGSIVSSLLLKKDVSIRHIPISVVLMTVFIVDLSFCADYIHLALTTNILLVDFISNFTGIRIILDLFAYSFFAGLYIVPLITMLQVLANRKIRARVFAINDVINLFFMTLAVIICFSFIKFGLTLPKILTIIALFNVAVSVYICILLPAHILRIITKKLIDIFYDIEISGIEYFEKCKAGTIIIANHTSVIDGIILSVTFGEKLAFAINTDVTKKLWVKPFLKMVRFFPVDNTNVMVVKSIVDEIKKGQTVVIFPEGRITTTGGLMKVYPGPAVIADKSNADILPICIEGVQYSDFSYFGAKIKNKHQRKIKLTILPPRKLNVDTSLSESTRRNIAITKLYDIMCEMKFASNFSNKTLIESLIDSLNLVGRKKDILEGIDRNPVNMGEFVETIFAFSNKISKQLHNQEYVGIIGSNTKLTVEFFFSLLVLNKIPVMLNYTDSIDNILFNINNVGLKTIYTSKFFVEVSNLKDLITKLEAKSIQIIYIEDIEKSITSFNKISATIKSYFPKLAYKKVDINSPAVVLFTMSSDKQNKAIVLSHKNLQASIAQLSSVLDFGILDSFFNAMPMFSSLGLVAGTLLPLIRGIRVVVYHSPIHYKMISELVYDTNSTVLLGTDTFLGGYAKNAHPFDFYSIRYVIAGIEKLKEETVKMWEDNFGKRIFEAYGTTETASTISINTPMYFKENTVGRILPWVDYKLEQIQDRNYGKLYVKGPNVVDYYIENKKLIPVKNKEGWFDTEDIVEIQKDEFLFVKGKDDRFIKKEQELVSLNEQENIVCNLWPEHKNIFLKINDTEIVLFTNNSKATIEELNERIQENQINNFVLPIKIEIIDQFPTTRIGSIDYKRLKDIYNGFNK